ncbi:hypothetical protein ACFQMM_02090 [Saliphagus sp. GCM10025308]
MIRDQLTEVTGGIPDVVRYWADSRDGASRRVLVDRVRERLLARSLDCSFECQPERSFLRPSERPLERSNRVDASIDHDQLLV